MKTFTFDDIYELYFYFASSKYLPKDWEGTALDMLKIYEIPAADRLWLVLNNGWIDDETINLFNDWCVRNKTEWAVAGDMSEKAWEEAWDRARLAALDVDRDAQIKHLIEVLEQDPA